MAMNNFKLSGNVYSNMGITYEEYIEKIKKTLKPEEYEYLMGLFVDDD